LGNAAVGGAAPNTVFSSVRSREYLTGAEIERLMAAARASSRYGHRDSTMILLGYRHGLRASELCDLEWSQIEPSSTICLAMIPFAKSSASPRAARHCHHRQPPRRKLTG